jgi:hypothetical protein
MHGRVTAVVVYLAVMTIIVYPVFDRGDAGIWVLPILVALHVAIGFAVGRWWAVVVPMLVVVISIPAGNPPLTHDNAEPFPLFVTFALMAVLAVPLVACGVMLRRVYEARRIPELLSKQT